ncbi:MAG TPA: dolichyl-phosphate beta-glucosyltransferase [Anaerolineales bacterium]|nr:dolichyl-phosphate beta-glucosyltransferase [Anaerolineales bacterium]
MSKPYLSIIIPAYNEERRLPDTLREVVEFISSQSFAAEVLVVENGSHDRTWEIAQQFEKQYPAIRAFKEEQRGKGFAVRRGMLEARGEYRFMCDADLSMPLEEIRRFLPPVLTDFDIAIGSREASGAIRYNEPFHRHWGGRLINLIIRILALPGMHDTQCGFKCFRAPVAEAVFRQQTLAGLSFDIEILFITRRMGFRIVEIPISWYFNSDSKVSPGKDAIKMTIDILKVRWNALKGVYNYQNP